ACWTRCSGASSIRSARCARSSRRSFTLTAPEIADIQAARARLDGVARVTPVYRSETLTRTCGREVHLKAENLQRTGSFKIRGAYNRISQLSEDERAAGVVAASAGNHGQAVAWAAREVSAKARIFMPQDSPMAKVEATRHYGAEVELTGPAIEESLESAQAYVAETGATLVHPFEDPVIIAGQGTIGLEIADQVEGVDTVLIPIGGGGLASGIAIALRAVLPKLRIVGLQAAGTLPSGSGYTLADGVAAMLSGKIEGGGTIVPLLSGGNIDATLLIQVMRHGLAGAGRYLVLKTRVPDRPGELAKLLTLLGQARVNVV